MKNYLIISFITILIFSSCSSTKEKFNVINDLLTNDKSFILFHGIERNEKKNGIDTILLSNKTIPSDLINNYSLDFDSLNLRKPLHAGNKVVWIDPNHKISLTQPEIYFLRSQINDELINLDKIKINNIIKVNSDSIYKIYYKYNHNKMKKIVPHYSFSNPLISKSKNIALVLFNNGTNDYSVNGHLKNCMLILKKVKNKWVIYGYERDIGVDH